MRCLFKESSLYLKVTSGANWQPGVPAAFPPCCASELFSQQSSDVLMAFIQGVGLQPHKAGCGPHKSMGRLCCVHCPSKGSCVLGFQMPRKGEGSSVPSCPSDARAYYSPLTTCFSSPQRTKHTQSHSFTIRFYKVESTGEMEKYILSTNIWSRGGGRSHTNHRFSLCHHRNKNCCW